MKKFVVGASLLLMAGMANATVVPVTSSYSVAPGSNFAVGTVAGSQYFELSTGANAAYATFDNLFSGSYPITYELYTDSNPVTGAANVGTAFYTKVLNATGSFSYLLAASSNYVLEISQAGVASLTTVSAVPLPGAALLFGSALFGAGAFGRKRKADRKDLSEAVAA